MKNTYFIYYEDTDRHVMEMSNYSECVNMSRMLAKQSHITRVEIRVNEFIKESVNE